MRIVVDAMGGDHAPGEIVAGAVEASREYGVDIVLVGENNAVQRELSRFGNTGSIEIVHAPDVITMSDSPAVAIRKKKESSIVIATKLVKEGYGDAILSAGNTGAAMAAALFGFGRIKGIDRPAIASVMPKVIGNTILLDVGANVDSKPQNLLEWAVMGSTYAEKVLGKNNPRVALLNIGEEQNKGNELTHAAYPLLEAAPINFVGNVEGRDVTGGKVDVVVCDGFVGNIVLKFGEGLAMDLFKIVKEELTSNIFSKVIASLLLLQARGLKKKLDYTEYGGAPLLGVEGISIITHGSSKAKAIKHSIRTAKECVESRYIEAVKARLEENAKLEMTSPCQM